MSYVHFFSISCYHHYRLAVKTKPIINFNIKEKIFTFLTTLQLDAQHNQQPKGCVIKILNISYIYQKVIFVKFETKSE